jgi:hypothetical protein
MPPGVDEYRGTAVAPYRTWKHALVRRPSPEAALGSTAVVDEIVAMARAAEPLLSFVGAAEQAGR